MVYNQPSLRVTLRATKPPLGSYGGFDRGFGFGPYRNPAGLGGGYGYGSGGGEYEGFWRSAIRSLNFAFVKDLVKMGSGSFVFLILDA
ncbi:hypothetical protein LWI29_019287 [Acer saccharum]|uniref:Uncharacterized protein n=1 Tax=Acer saccharum TaxID=4024 RepID=A0AA39RW25_ACESA|nr:hypothetical protein LWI29_019287 [Acer saccharum]